MNAMKISLKGAIEIAGHEVLVPAPYLDSVNVWTFGIGHTASAGEPNPEKMPRGLPENPEVGIKAAIEIFRQDLKPYERRVAEAIRVPLLQHQFDALVSFDFNTGGIKRAKLTTAINNGDPEAARHFMGWLKPSEIYERRTSERRLFETGKYRTDDYPVSVWNVSSAGKLQGVLKNIRSGELTQLLTGEPNDQTRLPWYKRWFGGK